jgi:hypothetical protein
VPPSSKFNSVAVASRAANFVKSACTSPETPSSKFNSVAVEVKAVPASVKDQLTSKFPLMSIRVEFNSISSSALMSKSPSVGEPILIAESLN